VWLPPGANRFCRAAKRGGKQVAYATQFETKFNRAITAREKVKDRLIGTLNRREWELPPKRRHDPYLKSRAARFHFRKELRRNRRCDTDVLFWVLLRQHDLSSVSDEIALTGRGSIR
jgi:hypothetical protein